MSATQPEPQDTASQPEPWFGPESGSAAQTSFRETLRAAPGRTLLLDYDGTLAPFQTDKMQAFPYPGVAEVLAKLYRRVDTQLVIVTGRPVADLPPLLPLAEHLELWGSHGREHVDLQRHYTLYEPTAEQRSTLDLLQKTVAASLCNVALTPEDGDPSTGSPAGQPAASMDPLEIKPASLAIHWRGLTSESQAAVREIADAAYNLHGNASVTRLPFASGVEFRAAGFTKAFAVQQILQRSGPGDLLAYLGDDLTDEDAFAALGNRGLSILVRPTLRASHAAYWLCPPEELLAFLELFA